ncbi:MAG: hypothetical protein KAT68_08170 [Bacteroidales bacterium]|nr:hypothetical protein [Bacteroidales bacterium]
MGLSSNSIIHFTKTSDALKEILSNNFKIFYSRESIILEKKIQYAAPMVSFCDIPLSSIKEHIGKYGSYGIGLTKDWAQSQQLNPVLYVDKKSDLSKSYNSLYNKYFRVGKKMKDLDDSEKHMLNLLRYIKNYEADLIRGGEVIKDYRYSDEREWRFLPDYEKCSNMAIKVSLIDTDEKKAKYNNSISDLRLKFEPNDIKYIIIEQESEISEFVDVLKKSKGNKYTYNDVERLMTRIITSEQIVTDL